MRLHSLALTNFRQHAATRFDFGAGITGIVGRNGAGKSTVLEAIAWALYGQPAARGTKDSIRSLRAPARAGVRVELDFELAGHRYRVVRGLTTAELYLDGAATPIATTLSAVTDLLQRALGMTRQEFFQTYFTGQKELAVMAAMSPGERGHFLSRVLGYDQLRVAQESLRERRRELTSEVAGMRATSADLAAITTLVTDATAAVGVAQTLEAEAREAVRVARTEREALAPSVTLAEQARTAYEALRVALHEVQRDLDHTAVQEAATAREIADLERKRDELRLLEAELVVWPALESERLEHERLARAQEKAQQITIAIDQLSARRTALAGRREELAARTLPASQDALSEVSARRTATVVAEREARAAWTRALQAATSHRDQLRVQHAALTAERDRLVALGAEGVCPTCTRALGDTLAPVITQYDERLAALLVEGRAATGQVTALAAEPAEVAKLAGELTLLTDRVRQLERDLAVMARDQAECARLDADLVATEAECDTLLARREALPTGYDAESHAAVTREIARLTPLRMRVVALGVQAERLSALVARREELAAASVALQDRVARLIADADATGYDEATYTATRDAFARAADWVRQVEIHHARAEAEASRAATALTQARGALAAAEAQHAQLEQVARDARLHHELDRVYTDLRAELNAELRPELSAIASGFLATLTEGRYTELELDEQYQVQVLDAGSPKPVISGGEEDLTNLALRLAISQMIADRNGHRLSLLVLDEIFGALDEQRQAAVVELLRSLGGRFEQILLITHLPVVRGQAHEIQLDYDASTGTTIVRSAA